MPTPYKNPISRLGTRPFTCDSGGSPQTSRQLAYTILYVSRGWRKYVARRSRLDSFRTTSQSHNSFWTKPTLYGLSAGLVHRGSSMGRLGERSSSPKLVFYTHITDKLLAPLAVLSLTQDLQVREKTSALGIGMRSRWGISESAQPTTMLVTFYSV